ncbi:hypothetical protein ACIQVR_38270 [Streptomyces xanthochromogenes]|uniref:hypothetical protein n=1 Tax=Streptomyces xanthochromogenes TaxID=67384 RepID=UPI0037FE8F2C
MHPIRVIRQEDRDSGPWPLISEHMDGEPRWVHRDVTATRVPHLRANGKRVRRDQLNVPDSFGAGVLCLIDRNGSFPSACSGAPLAPNKLLHTGPLDAFDKSQAGIYFVDIPERPRTDMPNPLGRIIDRPDEDGRVWVTTSHIKQPMKLVRDNHLAAMPTIYDSWTRKASESLFKPFYEATSTARTTRRGQQALEDAGLHVTTKTLINWLSDAECNVRRSYLDIIHTAYENVAIVSAEPIPDYIREGQYEISGVVKTGDDVRTRGTVDAAPLRIDGSRGRRDEIEELWLAGELTDDEFEDHFIDDVIVEDIGEGTDGWEFPLARAAYSVEIR